MGKIQSISEKNMEAAPERSGGGASTGDSLILRSVPDPEVPEKPVRRHYSASYKLRVLKEADACSRQGEIGALLRREGIYSSHLTCWRKQRKEGTISGLTPKKRGPRQNTPNPLARKLAESERQKRKLEQRLRQAEIIIEAQKKMSELMEIGLKNPGNGEKS